MSFFVREKIGDDEQFFFDGSRFIDAVINQINGRHEVNQYQYVANGTTDKKNIDELKLKLGSLKMEKQLLSQYTRNNTDGTKNIKNDAQKKLYDEFCRMNTFLSVMFLYFYHCFYYDNYPIKVLKTNGDGKTEYATYGTNGIPPDQIIDEIQSVYPQLNNIMMKLLQLKHNINLDIAIMKTQDVEEQLQDAQLTGAAEIKTKKLPQLKLKKK